MSKEPFEIGDTWDQVEMLSQLSPDSSQTQAAADAAQLGQAGISWYNSAHSWRFRDLYPRRAVKRLSSGSKWASKRDSVALMPGKPFQSKLEPFYGFIRDCRAKRWTYARIAEAITRDHTMSVSANAVFSFVKVRAKGRRLYTLPAKIGSGSSQAHRGTSETTGKDVMGPANSFFTPPDEASKPAHQQTRHEKRPYRLEF